MILISFLTATSFSTKNKARFHEQSKNFKQNQSIASDTKPATTLMANTFREERGKKANKILSEVKGHAREVR